MLPRPPHFEDFAILLLRLMVAVIFFTSGWDTLKDPEARSKNIGMSERFAVSSGGLKSPGASVSFSVC